MGARGPAHADHPVAPADRGLNEQPASEPPRWGLGDAALGYLAAFVLATVATGLWRGATGDDPDSPGLGLTLVGVAGLWTGFLGAVVLAARRKGSGRVADDFGLRFERGDLWLGLLGPATQVVVVLLYLLVGVEAAGRENDRLVDTTGGAGRVVLFVVLAVGAPVVEEVFYRGLVQRSLVRRLGPTVGIGLTAVGFGLAHFDPVAFPGITLFGLVLGLLAHRTGRLGPAIAAHVAFNALAVGIYVANGSG